MSERRDPEPYPVWLWPNLLGLDAAIVALLWYLLLTWRWRHLVAPGTAAALVATTWLVYLVDHLLDAREPARADRRTARHRFSRTHRGPLTALAVLLTLTLAALAVTALPAAEVRFGLSMAGVVALYLAAVHLLPFRVPKKFLVGCIFALGIAGLAHGDTGPWTGRQVLVAVNFGLLCWTNCLAIAEWERQNAGSRQVTRYLALIAAFCFLIGTLGGLPMASLQLLSALALWTIDRYGRHWTPETLRVTADLALCTPLLALAAAWSPWGP